MERNKSEWVEWWQTVIVNERFRLMKKYEIAQVNDKLIKRMWLGEKNE